MTSLLLFLTALFLLIPRYLASPLPAPATPSFVSTIPTHPSAIPSIPDTTISPSPGVLNGTDCDAHDKVYQAAKWMLIITFAEVNVLGAWLAFKVIRGEREKKGKAAAPTGAVVVVKKEG
jgi:hypothetical protein